MVLASVKMDILRYPVSVGAVRSCYYEDKISFNEAINDIKKWREDDRYICFEKYDMVENKISYVYVKASKRGNDVYRWRVKSRFKEIIALCEKNANVSLIERFDTKEGYFCKFLKFTLTPEIKKYPDRDYYNKAIVSKEYDKFTKRLRKKYGEVFIIRSWESHKNGYIHVNVICLFPNTHFRVVNLKGHRDRNGNYRRSSWRLKDRNLRDDLKRMWDCGFVDIRAIETPHDLVEYAIKYQLKYFKNQKSKEMQNLTLGVLSLYNKRSYYMSKDFLSHFQSILKETSGVSHRLDINMRSSPHCDDNRFIYTFLGVFPALELDVSPEIWFFEDDKPPPLFDFDKDFCTFVLHLPDLNRCDSRVLGEMRRWKWHCLKEREKRMDAKVKRMLERGVTRV